MEQDEVDREERTGEICPDALAPGSRREPGRAALEERDDRQERDRVARTEGGCSGGRDGCLPDQDSGERDAQRAEQHGRLRMSRERTQEAVARREVAAREIRRIGRSLNRLRRFLVHRSARAPWRWCVCARWSSRVRSASLTSR